MRRSFGPGMGGGGCGGGGGGIIKTVHRAVRTGIGASSEPFSYSATRSTTNSQPINTGLFISSKNNNSSSPCSYLNQPVPAAPPPPPNWDLLTPPATGDECDWEYVDGFGSDGESVYGVYDDIVYGGVPSEDEVYHAVSSLQEVLEPVSFAQLIANRGTYGSDEDKLEKILSPTSFHKSRSDLDWIEPSFQVCNSTSTLQVPSPENVYDAFHLLQTEPLVQRMVISLSSDKAVWDAVMNNEVVRELRESINKADKSISEGPEDDVEDSIPVTQVLGWIFVNTKEKVIEIVDKITKIVHDLVQPMNKGEKPERDVNEGHNSFEKKLKSSFFLSIMILLIVVVSRARKG